MKINGVDTRKFTIKIGTPPFTIDLNNPERLRKLEDANRTGLGRVIKYDDPHLKKGKTKTSKATKKRTAQKIGRKIL